MESISSEALADQTERRWRGVTRTSPRPECRKRSNLLVRLDRKLTEVIERDRVRRKEYD